MTCSHIVAEGPQDIEFLIRLLKFHGLRRVTYLSSLDSFWEPLVPRTFPVDDDLMKRVPVPVFLQNSEVSIALHCAVGITRLIRTVEESLALIPVSQIFGIGLFLDADDVQTPEERFTSIISTIKPLGLSLPSVPGEVARASPHLGIFIAPDNFNSGTLEDILIDCAQVNYPDLLDHSKDYISKIDLTQLNQDDLREMNKPAGKNKATVSNISSVLKPGKTLQVSISRQLKLNIR